MQILIAILLIAPVLVLLSLRNFRLAKLLYQFIMRPALSKTVNYSIYFFRRVVLRQSIQQAKREHYEGYRIAQEHKEQQNRLTNIAVVNRNLNKYTETFIDQKVLGLQKAGYYVHRFYGGDFPNAESEYGHLISNNELGLSFYPFWEKLWGLPEQYFLKRAFTKYLRQHNIKLVFAEFGTCGVEIFEQCKEAGVPMIVTFRGYDIHHKDSIEKNKDRYRAMFDYCNKVICVSNDILNTIERQYKLGGKLVYLPSVINLDLFKPVQRAVNNYTILYVGRFAETKSPHLVIAAFNEVLKHVPDARLVMVGRGGGGELFEACLMLAKALNLEGKISFKGVLTPNQVNTEMQNAGVFIQYSVTTPVTGDKEGTPVSIREAMATGMAVVATKHAGIEEIIENEVTGLLVDEYDHHGIVTALLRVLTEPELARKLGTNAASYIKQNSLISHNTDVLTKIVEDNRLP